MSLDLLDLPVWSFRPNWAGGITERLEWLTNVMTSDSGSEQRQSARLSPRRSLEFTVNPVDRERTYADLFLHRMAADEMLVPLWHDNAKLTSPGSAGSTSLEFDTSYREHAAEQCVLLFTDAFTWEVAYTQSVSPEGLTLVDGLQHTWSSGTTVYPLRPAYLTDTSNLSALTQRVGQARVLLTFSRENDYAEESDMLETAYAGVPVLSTPPNRSTDLDQAYQRILQELDSVTGRKRLLDLPGRAFVTQGHNWQVSGREKHHQLRALLYYLRGRQRSIWIPTFNSDLVAARDHAAGSLAFDVLATGYEYTGGAKDGRNRVWSPSTGGMTITGVMAPPMAGAERLALSAPTAVAISEATSVSFMDIARMDQDAVEITHHTDIDGTCEVSCAFRTFRDARSSGVTPVHDTGGAA